MSGTPAQRSSARLKRLPPDNMGLGQSTLMGQSTVTHQDSAPSAPQPYEWTYEDLDKELRKAQHQLHLCKRDKESAEIIMREFRHAQEDELFGEQLKRFRSGKQWHRNAVEREAEASSKVKDIQTAIQRLEHGPRASVPISNIELPSERTKRNRYAASLSSTRSIVSRKKQIKLSADKELWNLEDEFSSEQLKLEDELAVLMMQLHSEPDEAKKVILQSKITYHEGKMDRHKRDFERRQKVIERKSTAEEREVDMELDEEQDLGSDEDDNGPFRDLTPEPRHHPTDPPYPNLNLPPQFQTQNIPRELEQLSALPQLQNCTIHFNSPNSNNFMERKLPEFDGNPTSWGTFYAAFQRTKEKFTSGVNMTRLQDALKGDAKAAVLHLYANVSNVDKIMEVLQRRFGKPEFILDYLVDQAKQSKPPEISKPHSIVSFGTLVEALMTNIQAYGETTYLNDRHLVMELIKKLPDTMKSEWGTWLMSDPFRKSTLEHFAVWMDIQVRKAELFVSPKFVMDSEKRQRGKRPSVNAVSDDNGKKKLKCDYCDKTGHIVTTCYAFKKLEVGKRRDWAKEKGFCFLCLKAKHIQKNCPSKDKLKCEKEGCTYSHHTLLHLDSKPKQKSADKEESEEVLELIDQLDEMNMETSQSSNHVASVNALSSAYLPVIPVVISGPKGKKRIFALLDSGASCSILEEDVANSIGLAGKPHVFNVAVLGKETRQEKSSLVQVDVAGSFRNAPSFEMKDVRTIPKLGITGVSVDTERLKAKYPHLKSMQMKSCNNATPRMIIGFDNSRLFAARRILEDADNEAPCAFRSLLGWYICETKQAKDSCNLFQELGSNDDNLNQMMKDFFLIENIGVKVVQENHRSQEDKKALQLMEKYTKQLDSGRWETCLLWKDENCKLPESYKMAMKRLSSMEKKMDANPLFAQLVQDKFAEYIDKGYLKKKKKKSGVPNSDKLWYLPWFFAFHSSKKPRLVFDGAAKSNGRCLNDFLFKGPDFLESLPGVLMRFRRHVIAVTADIKEMFHQVLLREEDRSSQTILYRGMDRSQPPEEYEMTVLFFGSACSPSSALYVKTMNALKYVEQHPKAVEAINRDCYMDDLPTGAESVEKVIELQKVVTSIHQDGGFPMVKWNSNNDDVYDAIPKEIRSEKKELMRLSNKSDVEYEKTLGLLWDPDSDCFLFEFKPKPQHLDVFSEKKTPTKREICSILMSLFDPLGFLAPLKIKGLIIMQSVWRTEIGWDDEVPDNLAQEWITWMQDLASVKGLTIDRRLSPFSLDDADDIQLHIFVDASQEAYAASAYLRIQTGGSIAIPFVLGKSRVAPLKHLTIPRMELQAAVLGTRLEQTVKAAYSGIKISKVYFWSDSRTVLCWIRSSTGKWNVFVANRIGEILESTNVESWKWVPTKENPSDAATRSNELSLETWLHGPNFLLQPEDAWPKEKESQSRNDEDSEEIYALDDGSTISSGSGNALKLEEVLPNITRFSSWFRLVRATAWVLAAVRRFRSKLLPTERGPPYITKTDLDKAKRLLTIQSQHQSFSSDMKELVNHGHVGKKSRIYKLSPMLKDGVIVMDSRIRKALVSAEVRHPPILDPKNDYTKLMVKWFHHTGHHYGQERVINELRQQAWIISCREAVRKCKSECLICKRRSVMAIPPEMGQLPSARLEPGNTPFHHCGVDYFGPIDVKVKRSTEKRWGVIYTCLTTRAVHVDVAQSLSTSDFMSTLIRFVNLRGKPAHVWSDNGTNFVGAEREIREHLLKWNQAELNAAFQVQGIEFHFIPPGSPHMGGCWERLIQDVKKILRQILHAAEPSDELLRTLLAEVTGILNSRPITRASPDPDDYLCLTPNDLLNIPCVVGPSITGMYGDHHRYAKSWERCQLLARQFWERWSKEYLPWLAQRRKWFAKTKPLEVGDIVVVLEDNAPRNSWKLGIITATFPQDGQVRKVQVKVAHVDPKDPKKKVKFSTLIRPTVKIGPLSLDKETCVSGGSVVEADLRPTLDA